MLNLRQRIQLTKYYYQFGLLSKYEYLARLGDLHAEAAYSSALQDIDRRIASIHYVMANPKPHIAGGR